MDIKEKEFTNGTLLYVPFGEGELGMFVGHPDDAVPHKEDQIMLGSPLDFVVRKNPTEDWLPASHELCDGINAVVQSIEKVQSLEPIGEPPEGGQWSMEQVHRTILAFMKRALTAFVEKRLN